MKSLACLLCRCSKTKTKKHYRFNVKINYAEPINYIMYAYI